MHVPAVAIDSRAALRAQRAGVALAPERRLVLQVALLPGFARDRHAGARGKAPRVPARDRVVESIDHGGDIAGDRDTVVEILQVERLGAERLRDPAELDRE